MARLQILELPEGDGDDRPPFILVIDQADEATTASLGPTPPPDTLSPLEGAQRALGVSVAEQIGARAVLVFEDTIDIPANNTSAFAFSQSEQEVAGSDSRSERANQAEAKLKALFDEASKLQEHLDEARTWARHGYEIGQKHCSWSDHGVAPAWLTEGWPPHFDSCEHLKQAAELEEAVARVRATSTEPEVMNANQEHPGVWEHGYGIGVRAAKAALHPRNEPAVGRNDG